MKCDIGHALNGGIHEYARAYGTRIPSNEFGGVVTMKPEFHLSIGVRSIETSVDFFVRVLNGTVLHRDPSGYVNVDLAGSQITLKHNDEIVPDIPDLHFGINLGLVEFDALAKNILESGYDNIVMKPKVVDANTPFERKKMYLKCPAGYLIELKGYKESSAPATNLIIRRAEMNDRSAIDRIRSESIRGLTLAHYSADQVAAWSKNKGPEKYPVDTEQMIVAVAGEDVVGFGELHLKTHEVRAVYVSSRFSRKGIGRRILSELEMIARAHGLTDLHLGASLNAIEFYKSHGYSIVNRDCKMTTNGVEAPYASMTKILSPDTNAANLVVPVLETDRLKLRGHRIDDFEACVAMWVDPIVVRYISGKPSSRQQTWSRLMSYRGHWMWMGFGYWAAEEKATGKFVGELGFADFKREIEPPIVGVPELGWAFASEFHGKGYATEALQAVVAWGDEYFGSRRTVCIIDPANAASLRLADKCGYSELLRTTYGGQPTIMLAREESK